MALQLLTPPLHRRLALLQVAVPEGSGRALRGALLAAAPELNSHTLALLTWAVARLQWRDAGLLCALSGAVQARITAFSPQALAQLAWAFAALDHLPPRLAQALAQHCAAHAGELAAVDKARVLWAFAQLSRRAGLPQPHLRQVVAAVKAGDVRLMQPAGVASLLQACAQLERHPG